MSDNFYDLHCHIMDMSHPDFTGFVKRRNIQLYTLLNALPLAGVIFSALFRVNYRKLQNLLAFIDRSCSDQFFVLDDELKTGSCDEPALFNDGITIGGHTYKQIVLTPLILDFGNKNNQQKEKYKSMAYYDTDLYSHKSIKKQTVDLFNAIQDYYREGRNLFKIYPFLGLNTRNYLLENADEDKAPHTSLKALLKKYFSGYRPEPFGTRSSRLDRHRLDFDGDINHLTTDRFAGIKVYPPLGFDPWPEDKAERRKVKYLYRFCVCHGIPITTHCSDGGFVSVAEKQAGIYTQPARWREPLRRYPDLRLNLAHIGRSLNPVLIDKWAEETFKLMISYPHVYADVSNKVWRDNDYKSLARLLQKLDKKYQGPYDYHKKLLFGTDVMINLLNVDSYGKYLRAFARTGHLDNEFKNLICGKNPESFLGAD